jgi:hypothetical protein
MVINKNGVTRLVFVFKDYVVKTPKFTYSHSHFLNGCYANWSERMFCKVWRNCKKPNLYRLVAPTIWCSWFGLIQIQRKVVILDRNLTARETKRFSCICSDIKIDNFGHYNGRLVCVDYP